MSIIRTGFYDTYDYTPDLIVTRVTFDGSPEFSGRCLHFETQCERIMSDVWENFTYIVYWNGPEGNLLAGRPAKMCIDRGWGASTYNIVAKVDATPEVMEAYSAWKLGEKLGQNYARAISLYDRRQEEEISARKNPAVRGRYVRVSRGRKVPIGTEGLVFWTGEDNYGNIKIGIATSTREDSRGRFVDVVWTAAKNCDVIKSKNWFD